MVQKSTTTGYKTELFMPIMKTAEGDYIAVLSDDSTDRDDEYISKGCIQELGRDEEYLAALCNHDNDIFMMVAEWKNRRVEEIDGHTALIAEPYFYKSNPNAQIIKGMLDEGAKPGISIGAMVKNYEEVDGKTMFTELEIVEASFVGVPSNRHGRAMAVAKSFNKTINIKEGPKVEKEYTKKELDSAIEKKVEETKKEFEKQLEEKKTEIEKLNSEMEKVQKEHKETVEKMEKEHKEAIEKEQEKQKELEKQVEAEKNKALEKQQYASQGGEPAPEDVEKSFEEGKMPIMRM